jgi:hypothetical protein
LKSRNYAQAAKLVARANANGGVFAIEDCSTLSVYQKIRAFVLWIQGSDDRRAKWRRFYNIMIPLDVNTRWNALFLMMFKARANKGSITRFAYANLEVQHLVPIDSHWETCEIIERVLEPFYDFTRSVSKEKPCLPETIGIM